MARKAAPRTKRSPPRKTQQQDKLSDAPMPVTSARTVEAEPAQAQPVFGGPTTGYRDGLNGIVETKVFHDGVVPEGWFDTPADCEGNWRDGMVSVP